MKVIETNTSNCRGKKYVSPAIMMLFIDNTESLLTPASETNYMDGQVKDGDTVVEGGNFEYGGEQAGTAEAKGFDLFEDDTY